MIGEIGQPRRRQARRRQAQHSALQSWACCSGMWLIVAWTFTGCGPSPYDAAQGTPAPPAAAESGGGAAAASAQPGAAPSGGTEPTDSAPVASATPPPTAQPPEEPPPGRVKAQVGVGKRGRSLDDINDATGRIIVQPARSLFAFRERAVFEIQLPQALRLYQATNGKPPATHEEFMEMVVRANNIQLPELPEGQRYVFDPKQGDFGELMVEGRGL